MTAWLVDVLVGVAWLAVAVVLHWRAADRRTAVLAAMFAAGWLAGSLVPALVFVHRGPLLHLLLAYPRGRLGSSTARCVVVAAYADGLLGSQFGELGWTLGFAIALVAVMGVRAAAATAPLRRGSAFALVAAAAVAAPLLVGVVSRLDGAPVDVLPAYQAAVVLVGLAVVLDLRVVRWSRGTLTGLVVDLGRRPVGGALRERLARAIGDPTLEVAYVLAPDRAPVDEHGRPVALPTPGDARSVTPVEFSGQPLALLIHDPAALADGALIAEAASALSVAVANARLQADVRGRVADVERSTARLLDAAEAERRRIGVDLRAHVDPLLGAAAIELAAAGAERGLLERVSDVRDQLFRLAAGLDPSALERGLRPALCELAEHAGLQTAVRVPDGRFPAAVESCIWFTCAEALANALKHAGATRLDITVLRRGHGLRVEVADDGIGGADPSRGSGLRRLGQRVASAGGALTVHSRPGGGTTVVADLDLDAVA